MSRRPIQADLLLLLTAVIWGFAFVFQRMGMEHTGPFMFNGIRFALGAGVLVLYSVFARRKPKRIQQDAAGNGFFSQPAGSLGRLWKGTVLGLVLFIAASLQQVGIVYTSAGNAGFITGLYVILVPMLGMFMGFRTRLDTWIGAASAAIGMYLLSVSSNLTVNPGDLLVLGSAVFWALHVLLVGKYSPGSDTLRLSVQQYLVCSLLSLLTAFMFEQNSWEGIWLAVVPILYGGMISVGIGYTLQIVAQKHAPPAHAAIILSLETVFAVVGGTLVLAEALPGRKLAGCALMLAGMVIAQVRLGRKGA